MAKKQKGLTIDNVKHIALLAQLSLSNEEIKKFQKQLSDVLEYVDQLQEVDTSTIEETSQITGLSNVFNDDEAGECLNQSESLSNAKQTLDGYVKVPGIFEN